MPYNAQYARDAYQYFKGRGICVECHQRKAINGRVKCEVCTERRAADDVQRDKDALRRKAKERAERLKAQGICRDCGKRPVKGNSSRCEECLRLNCLRTKQRNAEKRVRKPQGICRRRGCENEVVSGMKTCAVHYPEMVQAAARMRESCHNEDHIWRRITAMEIARMKRRKKDEGVIAYRGIDESKRMVGIVP